MANNKAFKVKNGLELAEYAKDITDTAVDVYVYDTSLDSDSGAWRHRTQATSWYNETLNTATRGSRKEFPAVAVIVAESDTVTIYDGDDPDLPMWMVFNGASYTFIGPSTRTTSSVAMLNGILCIGRKNSVGYMAYTSFIDDSARAYSSNSGEYRDWLKPIVDRNTSDALVKSNSAYAIVNDQINDVAMTVLPNAPLDAATGLPVPTIAVATEGGLSIIKDDGSVIDYVATTAGWHPNSVSVYGSDKFMMSLDGGAGGYIVPIGSSDVSFNISSTSPSGWLHFRYAGSNANIYTLNSTQTSTASSAVAGASGATFIDVDEASYSSSLAAFITSSYNTGWMNGDIKLATLSDTDATSVTGAELVTNGDGSSTTGWTAGDAASGLSVVSAKLRITNNDATPAWAYQGITTVVGTVYTATLTYTAGTLSGNPRMYLGNAAGSSGLGDVLTLTSTVPASTTFTATATTTYLTIDNTASANGVYADYDNVSVRLAVEDRSVNGNGLQVFGTITKTVVETGADLVGYSGFGTSNYLEQPYNADLSIGSSDFSFQA